MALEPNTSSVAPASVAHDAAIENEIPTYRAISRLAVTSLLLGLLSVLCFASPMFLVAAVAAVLVGLLADRKIQRLSDVLTGRGIAQAGVALGLIFGLGAITTSTVTSLMRRQSAARFAQQYVQTLQKDSASKALWYRMTPRQRKDKDPEKTLTEMRAEMRDPMTFERYAGAVLNLKNRLEFEPGHTVSFVEIELDGLEALTPYAGALLRVQGPASAKYPAEEYALLLLKQDTENTPPQWWIDEVYYPYKPRSHVIQPKPVDDGHGHGGGGGHGH